MNRLSAAATIRPWRIRGETEVENLSYSGDSRNATPGRRDEFSASSLSSIHSFSDCELLDTGQSTAFGSSMLAQGSE